jgi:hypothetical protein
MNRSPICRVLSTTGSPSSAPHSTAKSASATSSELVGRSEIALGEDALELGEKGELRVGTRRLQCCHR